MQAGLPDVNGRLSWAGANFRGHAVATIAGLGSTGLMASLPTY